MYCSYLVGMTCPVRSPYVELRQFMLIYALNRVRWACTGKREELLSTKHVNTRVERRGLGKYGLWIVAIQAKMTSLSTSRCVVRTAWYTYWNVSVKKIPGKKWKCMFTYVDWRMGHDDWELIRAREIAITVQRVSHRNKHKMMEHAGRAI